jgi:hypothetical protein
MWTLLEDNLERKLSVLCSDRLGPEERRQCPLDRRLCHPQIDLKVVK